MKKQAKRRPGTPRERADSKSYPWRGFERPPEGCLFEQLIDLDGEMGVAYERCLRFEKDMHVHDRLLLVLPRDGTSMKVAVANSGSGGPREATSFTVTSDDVLAVPADLLHADYWVSEVYDTFALLPAPSLVNEAARRLEIDPAILDRVVAFKRNRWLSALVAEYFEERVLRVAPEGPRHASLELLIMMEAFRLASDEERDAAVVARPGPSSVVARALRHLEANLFSDVDLDDLCRASAMSRSSLLRHFSRELGITPKAYLL